MANVAVLSFNAGELSPLLDSRTDIEKYSHGCRRQDNLVSLIYGAARRRPGTRFVYDIRDVPYGSGLYGVHSFAG